MQGGPGVTVIAVIPRSMERQGFDLVAFREVPSSLLVSMHALLFRIYSCTVCLACLPTQPARCQGTVLVSKSRSSPSRQKGLRGHTQNGRRLRSPFLSFWTVDPSPLSAFTLCSPQPDVSEPFAAFCHTFCPAPWVGSSLLHVRI